MKMKKLIAMLICLVTCCLFLASCEDEIGGYLKDYDYEPDPVYNVMYDFYIICEDDTDPMAKSTVNEKINQLFGDKYNTKLNIVYLSATDYEMQLKVDLGLEDETATYKKTQTKLPPSYTYGGKIVLINNVEMLTYLGDKLVDLAPYLATPAFGTLNTQINAPLLTAANVGKYNGKDYGGKKLAIPNNRVYGEYEYICINRAIAENVLNFSALSQIPDIKSYDDAANLIAAYTAYYGEDADIDKLIRTERGQYDLKALINAGEYVTEDYSYAKDEDNDWMCNVAVYPTATLEVAYASAFGIIPSVNYYVKDADGNDKLAIDYAERAMQIIYSFNADKEMKNLLAYGVPNTNYRLEEGDFVNPLTEQGSKYNMNLDYCGDAFKAYYSARWTKAIAESGKNQVKEAVLSGN